MQPELLEILRDIQAVLYENTKVNNELLQFLHSNKPQIKQITLRDYRDKYINLQKQSLSASSIELFQYGMKHLIGFFESDTLYLSEITKEDVYRFRNYLFERAKSAVYWRTLKSSFNYAVTLGHLLESPFNIPYIKIQKTKKPIIRADELPAILANIQNRTIQRLVELAYLIGFRLGEGINIRLSDIDIKEQILTIGSDTLTTKSRKQRIIPLTDRALELVTYRKVILNIDKSNYIFSKKDGTKFSADYVSKTFKKAVIKAGLNPSISFHSLRHSFATNLAQAGTPINTVKELLGHSSVKVTEIYFNHENISSLKKGISNIN